MNDENDIIMPTGDDDGDALRQIDAESGDCARETDAGDEFDIETDEEASPADDEVHEHAAVDDREEYERLIKERFKELFREDTQRLINKRFKKYKALEEKVRRLEDEASRYADIESLIAAERERAVRETEERMNLQFKAMRSRASENAVMPRISPPSLDVSRLTKSERAFLASRAQKGEKIKL